MNIQFDLDTMNKLFPFYIAVDPDGQIVSSGQSMKKLLGLSPQVLKFH